MEQSSLKQCVDDSAAVAVGEVSNQCDVSRREALVAVMQAADFRDGDDSSDAAMLNRAGVGAIFIERKMRAGALVVVDVRGQDAAEMALIEDDDVVQALPSDRADGSLDVGVLPW